MSVRTKSARSPSGSVTAVPRASSTSATTTTAPAVWNARTIVAPRSDAPPVTSAALPVKSNCVFAISPLPPRTVIVHAGRAGSADLIGTAPGAMFRVPRPKSPPRGAKPVLQERIPNLKALVEPDRVHRLCYTDPDIFELELASIFEKYWIYAGHESQVKKPGDFWTFQIDRQPMSMIRGHGGKIHVLYNRCPHRGTQIFGARYGNAGDALTCSYHAWRYHYDGTIESLPLARGYEGTTFSTYDCNMQRAPRVA